MKDTSHEAQYFKAKFPYPLVVPIFDQVRDTVKNVNGSTITLSPSKNKLELDT